jgi:hypothetical protein
VSRHKTIQIVLVAATLLLAAGTPAAARGVDGHARARVTKQEQHRTPTFMRWLKMQLKRYAMAAN